jgi:predicted dehydrogenase
MEGEGTSNVILRFASGAMGYHFGTWGARGTRLRYSFHVHCTKGMLDLRHEGDGWQLSLHTGGNLCGGREQETVLARSEAMKATAEEMAHFLDCVETGAEPRTHGRDSLTGLRAIWRLYEAEQRGGMADLRGLALSPSKGPARRGA